MEAMKKAAVSAVLLTSLLSGCFSPEDPNRRTKIGATIGAVTGAILGHQLDGGAGRWVGAVAGGLAGGFVGK